MTSKPLALLRQQDGSGPTTSARTSPRRLPQLEVGVTPRIDPTDAPDRKPFWVHYTVSADVVHPKYAGRKAVGPYLTETIAQDHAFDIAGYEGVYGVSIRCGPLAETS